MALIILRLRSAKKPQQVHCPVQAMPQKHTVVPFKADYFKDRLANGVAAEHEEMHTALVLREQTIQRHLHLIQRLEEDSLGKPRPRVSSRSCVTRRLEMSSTHF